MQITAQENNDPSLIQGGGTCRVSGAIRQGESHPPSITHTSPPYEACGEHNVSNNSRPIVMLRAFNTVRPIFTRVA